MASFAVISEEDGRVEHLCRDRAQADGCARAARADLNRRSYVVAIVPPLASSRVRDLWVAVDRAEGVARTFPDADDVDMLDDSRWQRLAEPIRRGLPIQEGLPQFARAPC
jgi:hypothetical protein